MTFIVLGLEDFRSGEEPRYVQMTRRRFQTKEAAEVYAEGVAKGRKAIVAEVPDEPPYGAAEYAYDAFRKEGGRFGE